MTTLIQNKSRSLLLVPLFAAFAVSAQSARAAEFAGDTQAQVQSVLQGTTSREANPAGGFHDLADNGSRSRTLDLQEQAGRYLLGISNSGPAERTATPGSKSTSTPGAAVSGNRGASVDAQIMAQRTIVGRGA
jgi:hypothetical protein